MLGPGFVWSPCTPSRDRRLFVTPGHRSNPRPYRPWPPSSQKLARASPWAGRAGEQPQFPCPGLISGSPCPRGSSFSHLSAPLPLSKLKTASDVQRPAGEHQTSPISPPTPSRTPTQELAWADRRDLRPQWRGTARQGRVAGSDLRHCQGHGHAKHHGHAWAALTTTLARRHPGGFHAAPQAQPSIPRRDAAPWGPRDTQRVLRGCSGNRTRRDAGDQRDT